MPQTGSWSRKALEAGLRRSSPSTRSIARRRPAPGGLERGLRSVHRSRGRARSQLEFPVLYAMRAKQRLDLAAPSPELTEGRAVGSRCSTRSWRARSRRLPVDDPGHPLAVSGDRQPRLRGDYLGRLAHRPDLVSAECVEGRTAPVREHEPRRQPEEERGGHQDRSPSTGWSGWRSTRAGRRHRGASRGLEKAIAIGDTMTCDRRGHRRPLPPIQIDEPTLSMTFRHQRRARSRGKEGRKFLHLPQASASGSMREDARAQRLARGSRSPPTRQGRDSRRRPRRAAARHPHRDHAPRRLRARPCPTAAGRDADRRAERRSGRSPSRSCSSWTSPRPSCRRGRWRSSPMRKGRSPEDGEAHGSGAAQRIEFHDPHPRADRLSRTELLTDTRGTAVMNAPVSRATTPWQGGGASGASPGALDRRSARATTTAYAPCPTSRIAGELFDRSRDTRVYRGHGRSARTARPATTSTSTSR